MIIGIEKVVEWLKMNKTPYWQIRKNEKSSVIIPSSQSEGLSITESADYFRQALNMLGPGHYFIMTYHNADDKKSPAGWLRTAIQVGEEGSQVAGFGNVAGSITEQVAAGIEQYRKDQELTELKQQVLELDNVITRAISRAEPYIPAIMEGLGLKAQHSAVAGIPYTGTEKDLEARLESALERWRKVDPNTDLVKIIEQIVILAETDPEKYKIAKSMLSSN